jgi:hypothetical protein
MAQIEKLTDQEIPSKGFECFDGLYAQFKK